MENESAQELRHRIYQDLHRMQKTGVAPTRLVLAGSCYDALEPTLLHDVADHSEVFHIRGDYGHFTLPVSRDPTRERSYYLLETSGPEDDRDLDMEYVDADGNRIDATGEVVERTRRYFRLFLGRE